MPGKPTHGMSRTRLYQIWDNIRGRTLRPSNTYFSNYGGRGIALYKPWHQFTAFMEWALANGYDDTKSIDRIDNNGDYEPSNCRWVTRREQDRNKRSNIWIDYNGERICQQDLAQRLGVHYSTIYYRLKTGQLKVWKD